ncbi:MAG: DUF885 family protein, partial [Armatimonadota bacterium]
LRAAIDEALRSESLERSRRRRIDANLPLVRTVLAIDDDRHDHREPDFARISHLLEVGARDLETRGTRDAAWIGHAPDALRARQYLEEARETLSRWWAFHLGYHPEANWWCSVPVARALSALETGAKALETSTGDGLTGDPIGEQGILQGLARHRVDIGPDELVAAARREMEHCLNRLREAARELGCPDPRAAIEQVKDTFVSPGEQPRVVNELAAEAIAWVEKHDMITVDPIAKETWRMTMISAESQRTNPFFLGGECIHVSYPTSDMDDERKRMSLRGNNPAFSRATVQHELIPGHHLQQFHERRSRPYRGLFATPFWIEGWTLHWEMLLWDRGFPRTPEERIGMLFWRLHRCARILFSIDFHRGRMTGPECVDYLVDRAFHERA